MVDKKEGVDIEVGGAERIALFDKKLELLQQQYGVKIYPAQQVMQSGELVTMIKVMDMVPVKEELKTNEADEEPAK